MTIEQSELGHFILGGSSQIYGEGWDSQLSSGPYAVGKSPASIRPDNGAERRALASHPRLQPTVSLTLEPAEKKVTTADVLEALHRATRLPIIADHYTRLYPARDLATTGTRLFDALSRLADAMRMRWQIGDDWLQFRTASYYHDRLKEVPNRLLRTWSSTRQRQGTLSLDHLVEIAGLSEAQLDAADMAEGARDVWGLHEWDLARERLSREHLRFLADFTPELRQEALGLAGLLFARMPLAQQQRFLTLVIPRDAAPLRDLSELSGATLRVEYTQPGSFQWGDPGLFHNWTRWVVPVEPGQDGRRVVRPPIHGRTREEVMQAMRRLEPRILAATVRHADPRLRREGAAIPVPLESQIFPTERSLVFIYIPSLANGREIRIEGERNTNYQMSF